MCIHAHTLTSPGAARVFRWIERFLFYTRPSPLRYLLGSKSEDFKGYCRFIGVENQAAILFVVVVIFKTKAAYGNFMATYFYCPYVYRGMERYLSLQSSGCKFSKKQETMKVMSHLCKALFRCKYFMFMVCTRTQAQHNNAAGTFPSSPLAHRVHRWVLLKFYGPPPLLPEIVKFNLESSIMNVLVDVICIVMEKQFANEGLDERGCDECRGMNYQN